MKKLLVLLVVAAMVLSFAGSAFAFTDIAANSDVQKTAISKLNALNVIGGYPDGTFKPANNITRAEFAKIAVIIAGLEKSADVLKNVDARFSDVKKGAWYTGYVNLAEAQGYVKGYPDGTFKPNATISNAEVVTVLLRILGYTDALPGPWPVDYIVKAAAIDVTKDVSFTASAAATRADVAVMAGATLDATLVSWSKDKEEFELKKDGSTEITLLAEKFKGKVKEDYQVAAAGWFSLNNDKKYVITFEGDDPDTTAVETTFTRTVAKTAAVNGPVIPYLKNQRVNFIFDTKEKEIVYIDVKSTTKKSDEVKFDGSKIKVGDVKYDYVAGVTIPAGEFFTVYFNKDGKIYRIAAEGNTKPYLVDKYDAPFNRINYLPSGSSASLKDKEVIVVKNGKFATLNDISKFDVVYVHTAFSGVDFFIEVFTMKSGKVDATYADSKVAIDGVKYKYTTDATDMSKDNGDTFITADFTDTYGKTVKYALRKNNSIAYVISDIEASTSTTQYGIITKIVDASYVSGYITKVKVLTANGNETTYNINTEEIKKNVGQLNVDEAIKFRVASDGSIDKLFADPYTVDANGIASGEIDKDNSRIKLNNSWYFLTSSTIIFNTAYSDASGQDGKQAAIEKVSDLLNASALTRAVKYELDGSKVKYLVIDNKLSNKATYATIADVFSTDKNWVRLAEGLGTYEVANLNSAVKKDLVKYTITGGKLTVSNIVFKAGSATPFAGVTNATSTVVAEAEIKSVDTALNAIKIGDNWYIVDADTIIYNYSDENPVKVSSLAGVSAGGKATAFTSDDTTKTGYGTILLYLIITE